MDDAAPDLPLSRLGVPTGTEPMEALSADALPSGEDWQFEPKWDGFRCLAFRSRDVVDLRSKAGKPLGRYFPDVVALLAALPVECFVLDGELVIPIGEELSFDELQLRLHPAASRVNKLAAAHPADFVLFDMLADTSGESLLERALKARRDALEAFVTSVGTSERLRLSPFTCERDTAEDWLARSGTALDGVVAKRRGEPYRPGERAMVKVKRLRSADCVVGGFRTAKGKAEVGSLLLGLFNAEGGLDHVGFTSGFADLDRSALTRQLEALSGGPGFTGRAPGGPSRWSTERSGAYQALRHELVVEVRYDHVTGDRFRHGTKFLRWRPDKAARHCTLDQLAPPADPARLERLLGRA